MFWICYLRKRTLYLPTEAKVKTGGYMDIEPVSIAPVNDENRIRSALKEVIGRGNPVIPEILRDDYPEPCLLKYAGVKSWGAFVKGAFCWGIDDFEGYYRVIGQRKARPRGWEDDPDQTVILPSDATIDDLCDKLITMVQAKAALQ